MFLILALLATAYVPAAPGGASGGPAPAVTFTVDLDAEIAALESQRAFDPENPDTMERLALLLGQRSDRDGELAYSMCALAAYDALEFDDAKQKDAKLKGLSERLTRLDAASAALKQSRDEYLKDLTWALELYSKNKKWSNAFDVAGRILTYRPAHRMARDTVTTVLSKLEPDARVEAERLLGAGELRRPRAFLQEWRRTHVAWSQAGKAASAGYSVSSNIGYDVLQLSTRALENLALYYRRFYAADLELQQGKTEVHLCRTRAEFEVLYPPAKASPTLKGLLQSSGTMESGKKPKFTFQLFTYDPRDEGRPLSFLFETLAHEASHQYMRLSTGWNAAPLWLDEGMATFFEGARLERDGSVSAGLPPWERLRVLNKVLDADEHPLRATLEGPGEAPFLTPDQYSVAWGLVYYLDQHQTESGERPYRPALRSAIEAVRADMQGGMTIFERAVLDRAQRNLDAFEREWIAEMRALHARESDPDAAAAWHFERGQGFASKGLPGPAREEFDRVLLYAREHAGALLGRARLAQVVSDKSKRLEDKDVTLLWARRAHRAAVRDKDSELEKAAAVIARAADPGGFDKIAAAEARYRKSVEREIEKHLAANRPRTALALARRWLDEVLGDDRGTRMAVELREKDVLRLERVYLPFDGKSLDGLSCLPKLFDVEEGELVCRLARDETGVTRTAPMFVESEITPRFRLEGELLLADAASVVLFGVELPWRHAVEGFALRPKLAADQKGPALDMVPFHLLGAGTLARIDQVVEPSGHVGWAFPDEQRAALGIETGKWVRFTLERESGDVLSLTLDGQPCGQRTLEEREDGLRVGLVFYGGGARLRNLRVVELDRL